MSKELGSKIRQMRKRSGLTQNELADRSGISFRTIQKIEDGSSVPRVDTLDTLCQSLGVSIAELIEPPENRSRSLSATAITGPLLPSDCALILNAVAELPAGTRAIALALIFCDPSLARGFQVDSACVEFLSGILPEAK